jgi:hypothetical protein
LEVLGVYGYVCDTLNDTFVFNNNLTAQSDLYDRAVLFDILYRAFKAVPDTKRCITSAIKTHNMHIVETLLKDVEIESDLLESILDSGAEEIIMLFLNSAKGAEVREGLKPLVDNYFASSLFSVLYDNGFYNISFTVDKFAESGNFYGMQQLLKREGEVVVHYAKISSRKHQNLAVIEAVSDSEMFCPSMFDFKQAINQSNLDALRLLKHSVKHFSDVKVDLAVLTLLSDEDVFTAKDFLAIESDEEEKVLEILSRKPDFDPNDFKQFITAINLQTVMKHPKYVPFVTDMVVRSKCEKDVTCLQMIDMARFKHSVMDIESEEAKNILLEGKVEKEITFPLVLQYHRADLLEHYDLSSLDEKFLLQSVLVGDFRIFKALMQHAKPYVTDIKALEKANLLNYTDFSHLIVEKRLEKSIESSDLEAFKTQVALASEGTILKALNAVLENDQKEMMIYLMENTFLKKISEIKVKSTAEIEIQTEKEEEEKKEEEKKEEEKKEEVQKENTDDEEVLEFQSFKYDPDSEVEHDGDDYQPDIEENAGVKVRRGGQLSNAGSIKLSPFPFMTLALAILSLSFEIIF